MTKKGVELSINFIVIIIFSIVLLGMGIFLLAKVVGIGKNIVDSNGCDETDIKNQLASDRVGVCPAKFEMHKSDSARFYFGVVNTYDSATPKYFQTVIRATTHEKEGLVVADSTIFGNVKFSFEGYDTSASGSSFQLLSGQQKIVNGVITIPKGAPTGTYFVTLLVGSCDDPTARGSPPRSPCKCQGTTADPCYVPAKTIEIVVK